MFGDCLVVMLTTNQPKGSSLYDRIYCQHLITAWGATPTSSCFHPKTKD